MRAETHVWKTEDGVLVAASHPKAATLLYAPGDGVRPQHEELVRLLESESGAEVEAPEQGAKQATRGGDKAAKRDADK